MKKSADYFQDPADEKMFLQSSSQVFTSSEQGIFAHQPLTPQCDIQTDGQSNGFNWWSLYPVAPQTPLFNSVFIQ